MERQNHNGWFMGIGNQTDSERNIYVCIGECPIALQLINVSWAYYPIVFWKRTMGCLDSTIMEGLCIYDPASAEEVALAEYEGVLCYEPNMVELRYCSTNDRWEYQQANGTWADATEKFLDECGACIFPKRNPTPEHHMIKYVPRGFRVGYLSEKLNEDGEEIHYLAIFGNACTCDENVDGNAISGGEGRAIS